MQNNIVEIQQMDGEMTHICLKCMDLNPELRWDDMEQVFRAIWKTFPA